MLNQETNAMAKKFKFQHSILVALLGGAALVGCGGKTGDKAATQVAAKVNGTEISLHQVNYILTKAGNLPPDQAESARKVVLERLIDQEIFAARAVEEKLDRSPETMMAIELAKREILARAATDHFLATGEKLQQNEVPKYYLLHPELFAERKIYNLQEISFPRGQGDVEAIKAQIKQGKSMEQLAEYLGQQNIEHKKNGGVRAAEQVPLEFLNQLHQAKDGDILFLSDAKDNNIVRIVATRLMPIDEQKATPAIQQYIFTKHANEMREKQLKALKAAAKIEYFGQFAKPAEEGAKK